MKPASVHKLGQSKISELKLDILDRYRVRICLTLKNRKISFHVVSDRLSLQVTDDYAVPWTLFTDTHFYIYPFYLAFQTFYAFQVSPGHVHLTSLLVRALQVEHVTRRDMCACLNIH